MRQQQFEMENQSLWDHITVLMDDLRRPQGKRRLSLQEQLCFPAHYRQLCSHYALARGRGFSPALIEQLHGMVLRGHSLFYRQQGGWRWRLLGFISAGFPSAVRRSGGYFAISLLFFSSAGRADGGRLLSAGGFDLHAYRRYDCGTDGEQLRSDQSTIGACA